MTFPSVLRRLQGLAKDLRSEEGQALIEYAILVSLIAIVCVVALQTIGLGVSHFYSKINTAFP